MRRIDRGSDWGSDRESDRGLPLSLPPAGRNSLRLNRCEGRFLFCVLCLGLLVAAIAGCGSTVGSQTKADAISITNANGVTEQVTTLALASSVNLSMTPQDDRASAGVDWTVTCAGNPVTGSTTNGACGTLAAAHTIDGGTNTYTAPSVVPINAAITITATVTSDPSQSSSVSLTIVGLPIGVRLGSLTTNSPEVDTTLSVSATVSNDPTYAGVIFTATCGLSACGSFNPVTPPLTLAAQTSFSSAYTAPAEIPTGGAVTITATSLADTTKSASATLTITTPPQPVPVTVSVLPANIYVETTGSARIVSLTAIVGNDTAAAGVDWSVSCSASNCGSITPHTASGAAATYVGPTTVPSSGTVTITAASTTNPAVSATSTADIVTTAPIAVTMSSAPPTTITAGSEAALTATVTGDANNLGVNWTASCGSAGACGSFNPPSAHTASGGQIVYTAPTTVPTGSVVTITASSPAATPANPAIAVITILAPSPSVTLTQAPPAKMTALTQAQVSATVKNDVSPGGVTWSVHCGNTVPGGCGWVLPSQTASGVAATYTAPPAATTGTSVTITATSVADTNSSASSSAIAITPSTTLSVNFISSLPSQVETNATVNLTAAVANDRTNAGIDWQVCASGCGFFTVKPAIPAIPATATTPYIPAVPAVTATTVSAWPNGLSIPYTAPSQSPSSGVVAVAASAHANSAAANSGTIAISTGPTGPALNGVVQAGSQPVAGASVGLYAAGTSGYASASSQIATATTDKNGSFTVPAGYTCPAASSQVYLVATGGSVGTNTANPNLALMTALGSCSNLSSSSVVVNEVTTIGSVYATAPFAANDALTGNSSYFYLGTSSGNLSGLANAFAAVNNLVNISTGQANFVTPVGNAATPYVEINTLADMLNACTATSGGAEGDGSACGILFAATDLLGTGTYNGSIAPSDTLQAAFNIAQHPVSNYGYFLGKTQPLVLPASSSPFQPVLPALPNDWSISLNYTGGGGLSAASTVASFAIDASGDLWITDTTAGSVIEWNAVGAALSPSTGFAAGGGPIAMDANGNVWISGNGVLTELTNLGALAPGSPFGGVAGGGSDMAIDAQGNFWIANGGGVSEFSSFGAELSPAGGFTYSDISSIDAVVVDSSNNVWVGDHAANNTASVAELTDPGGQFVTGVGITNGPVLAQMAADHAGHVWVNDGNEVCQVPPYGGEGTTLIPTCWAEENNAGQSGSYLNFYNGGGVALDGAGTAWIASQGGGSLSLSPGVLPIIPSALNSGGISSPALLISSSLTAGPLRIAVDGSGNVWVLLANNTVTEYVSAATPAVTPVALAVKSNKLGSEP